MSPALLSLLSGSTFLGALVTAYFTYRGQKTKNVQEERAAIKAGHDASFERAHDGVTALLERQIGILQKERDQALSERDRAQAALSEHTKQIQDLTRKVEALTREISALERRLEGVT